MAKTKHTKKNNNWTDKKIEILKYWRGECKIYTYLYEQNTTYYQKIDKFLGIAGIFISAITGTTLVNQSGMGDNKPMNSYVILLFGLISIINTFIQSLRQFLDLPTKISCNQNAAMQNNSITMDIDEQLVLSRNERIDGKEFMKQIKARKYELIKNSPTISKTKWNELINKINKDEPLGFLTKDFLKKYLNKTVNIHGTSNITKLEAIKEDDSGSSSGSNGSNIKGEDNLLEHTAFENIESPTTTNIMKLELQNNNYETSPESIRSIHHSSVYSTSLKQRTNANNVLNNEHIQETNDNMMSLMNKIEDMNDMINGMYDRKIENERDLNILLNDLQSYNEILNKNNIEIEEVTTELYNIKTRLRDINDNYTKEREELENKIANLDRQHSLDNNLDDETTINELTELNKQLQNLNNNIKNTTIEFNNPINTLNNKLDDLVDIKSLYNNKINDNKNEISKYKFIINNIEREMYELENRKSYYIELLNSYKNNNHTININDNNYNFNNYSNINNDNYPNSPKYPLLGHRMETQNLRSIVPLSPITKARSISIHSNDTDNTDENSEQEFLDNLDVNYECHNQLKSVNLDNSIPPENKKNKRSSKDYISRPATAEVKKRKSMFSMFSNSNDNNDNNRNHNNHSNNNHSNNNHNNRNNNTDKYNTINQRRNKSLFRKKSKKQNTNTTTELEGVSISYL